MKEILQNIEKDIETVEGILKRLRTTRYIDGSTAFTISIYEDMLYELYSHRRSVQEYIKRKRIAHRKSTQVGVACTGCVRKSFYFIKATDDGRRRTKFSFLYILTKK